MAWPELKPGRRRAVQADGRIEIVARDGRRTLGVGDAGEGTQRHHLAGTVAGPQLLDVAGLEPEAAVGLDVGLVALVEQVELVDVARAGVGLQGREHVADRHAQALGLGPVDVDEDLRHVVAERGVDRGDARLAARGLDQRLGARPPAGRDRVLPPCSSSCIWKPLETPSPGIAGGISGEGDRRLRSPATRRRTSARIAVLVEPRLLALGERRVDEVHHRTVGERGAVVEQREAADGHPAREARACP